MKRRINTKLLAGLVLTVVIGAGAIHVVHGYLVQRSSKILLLRAEKVGQEGNQAEELDLLKRYLVYRPDDSAALERLGSLMAKSSSPEYRAQALATLERLLFRDPSRVETRRKAAELAQALGQTDAAKSHYEILIAQNPQGDAGAEEALGRCEEDLKRYREALGWYEKAIAHDPARVAAYARVAQLLRKQLKDPARADGIMDAVSPKDGVVARNPRRAQAYLERATYRREFAIPGSKDDIQEALKLAPDDADVLLAATAEVPPDEAIRLLKHGIEVHPEEVAFYEKLAVVEAGTGQRGQAIDHLKQGAERVPGNQNLHWLLAELEIDERRFEEASAQIKRLRELGLPAAPLNFLEGRILADTKQWTKAARLLTLDATNLESMPNATGLAKRAFLLLSRCQIQLGNPDMRYSAARRAVALDVPDPALTMTTRAELASALAGLGRLDESAEEYRVVLGMPDASGDILVDLARVLVAKNLRLPPQQRRWDEVEQMLDRAEARSGGSVAVAVLRAEVLVAQEKLDAAGDRLNQADAAHPENTGPRIARAALAERQGRVGEALELLEEARKRLGDRPELLAALIRYWSGRPGEAATRTLTGLIAAVRAIPDEFERWNTMGTLADGLDRIGEPTQARAIREQLVAEQPDHLGFRLAQLDAAFRSDNFDEAGQVLDEVQRIEGPEGSLWRYGRAQLLIQSTRKTRDPKALADASVLLAEARERRPGWTKATLAAAELDDLRGDLNSALRGYLDAIENGESSPAAVRRAVQLLYRQGRFAQADALLGRVQQDLALSPELGRLAADVALQTQDDVRAIDLARRSVAGRVETASDQTWLGQLLFAASKKAEDRRQPDEARSRRLEAEKALRRGVELAPTDPDARVALVLALTAWDRADEARAMVQAADPSFQGAGGDLALARCFEAVGMQDQAQAKYREILQARPDDVAAIQAAAVATLRTGKVRDAEPLLRRMIGLQNKTPREAAWARRVLALALSVEGPGGSLKARELLGLDADSKTADLTSRSDLQADDLRARAQILARQPGRAARRKAIEIIDALSARSETRPEDLFLLAQLSSADGDWPRARTLALQLLAEDASNTSLLAFLARGQIATPSPGEASAWIDALERLTPQAPLVVELRARVLIAQGKNAEAIALLGSLARNNPALGPGVAGLLEGAGQGDAAEALLRELDHPSLPVETRNELALSLGSLLGRRGRHADAIQICERLWADPRISPSRVSTVALTSLYTGHPERAVLKKVEDGVDAALRRKPADYILRFDKANLLILQERYAEAEAVLRALHESQPELSAPLNNLAWLLALQGAGGNQPLDLVDRAIALDGPSSDLLDTRGLVLIRSGHPERAIEDLEESIAVAPASTNYLHLAMAFQKIGRSSDAADAMKKARALGLRAGDVHPLERSAYQGLDASYPAK